MEYTGDFSNEDESYDDPSKAGFVGRWVGIANATKEKILIETHVECAVPAETTGIDFFYEYFKAIQNLSKF